MSCQTCRMRTVSFPSSKLKEVLDTVLRVDNKSGEVRPQPIQVFLFAGYEFHRDLGLVNPLREMAQFSGFDPTLKSNMFVTSGCSMALFGLLASMEKTVPEGLPHLRPLFSFTLRSTGDIITHYTASFLRQSLFHVTQSGGKSLKCDEGCRPLSQDH